MKRSDLKSYIKEQIVSTLEEATFQADKGDQSSIDAAKKSADKDDVIKISEIDDDEGDKEATKGARKNASKTKRLDAKIKAKRDIEAQMKSALNAFKKADTDESKETAKIALKKLTALKKEAEAEIKTLEGEII
tara:strand:+ start:414 stop:815 length:402 start_codon:yes stop_codon:yes gene_type:complete